MPGFKRLGETLINKLIVIIRMTYLENLKRIR
jgi:hypothetical protein